MSNETQKMWQYGEHEIVDPGDEGHLQIRHQDFVLQLNGGSGETRYLEPPHKAGLRGFILTDAITGALTVDTGGALANHPNASDVDFIFAASNDHVQLISVRATTGTGFAWRILDSTGVTHN